MNSIIDPTVWSKELARNLMNQSQYAQIQQDAMNAAANSTLGSLYGGQAPSRQQYAEYRKQQELEDIERKKRDIVKDYNKVVKSSLKYGIITAYAVTTLALIVGMLLVAAIMEFGWLPVTGVLTGATLPAGAGYGWHLWAKRKAKVDMATKLMLLP